MRTVLEPTALDCLSGDFQVPYAIGLVVSMLLTTIIALFLFVLPIADCRGLTAS